MNNNLTQVVEVTDHKIMTNLNESRNDLINLGITARRNGEPEKALEYFKKVILKYPEHFSGYVQARVQLQQLKRFDEASQCITQLLNRCPHNVDVFMKDRPGRINILSKINKATSYLEIGVAGGTTFLQIMIKKKIAVDPKFRFNYLDHQSEYIKLYEITSDEFFRTKTPEVFDFIYLDGLHTFEQTFRDFCGTLTMAHEKTIWLIDDTVPSDKFAADRSQQRCLQLRRADGIEGKAWMGDVFKVVYAIHDFFPQFNYATFTGHGQTVIWRDTRTDFKPHWDSLSAITDLSYLDFLETKEKIMNFADNNEIIARLKHSLDN
jgi:tetratricopeptide (TPR) repeat protein